MDGTVTIRVAEFASGAEVAEIMVSPSATLADIASSLRDGTYVEPSAEGASGVYTSPPLRFVVAAFFLEGVERREVDGGLVSSFAPRRFAYARRGAGAVTGGGRDAMGFGGGVSSSYEKTEVPRAEWHTVTIGDVGLGDFGMLYVRVIGDSSTSEAFAEAVSEAQRGAAEAAGATQLRLTAAERSAAAMTREVLRLADAVHKIAAQQRETAELMARRYDTSDAFMRAGYEALHSTQATVRQPGLYGIVRPSGCGGGHGGGVRGGGDGAYYQLGQRQDLAGARHAWLTDARPYPTPTAANSAPVSGGDSNAPPAAASASAANNIASTSAIRRAAGTSVGGFPSMIGAKVVVSCAEGLVWYEGVGGLPAIAAIGASSLNGEAFYGGGAARRGFGSPNEYRWGGGRSRTLGAEDVAATLAAVTGAPSVAVIDAQSSALFDGRSAFIAADAEAIAKQGGLVVAIDVDELLLSCVAYDGADPHAASSFRPQSPFLLTRNDTFGSAFSNSTRPLAGVTASHSGAAENVNVPPAAEIVLRRIAAFVNSVASRCHNNVGAVKGRSVAAAASSNEAALSAHSPMARRSSYPFAPHATSMPSGATLVPAASTVSDDDGFGAGYDDEDGGAVPSPHTHHQRVPTPSAAVLHGHLRGVTATPTADSGFCVVACLTNSPAVRARLSALLRLLPLTTEARPSNPRALTIAYTPRMANAYAKYAAAETQRAYQLAGMGDLYGESPTGGVGGGGLSSTHTSLGRISRRSNANPLPPDTMLPLSISRRGRIGGDPELLRRAGFSPKEEREEAAPQKPTANNYYDAESIPPPPPPQPLSRPAPYVAFPEASVGAGQRCLIIFSVEAAVCAVTPHQQRHQQQQSEGEGESGGGGGNDPSLAGAHDGKTQRSLEKRVAFERCSAAAPLAVGFVDEAVAVGLMRSYAEGSEHRKGRATSNASSAPTSAPEPPAFFGALGAGIKPPPMVDAAPPPATARRRLALPFTPSALPSDVRVGTAADSSLLRCVASFALYNPISREMWRTVPPSADGLIFRSSSSSPASTSSTPTEAEVTGSGAYGGFQAGPLVFRSYTGATLLKSEGRRIGILLDYSTDAAIEASPVGDLLAPDMQALVTSSAAPSEQARVLELNRARIAMQYAPLERFAGGPFLQIYDVPANGNQPQRVGPRVPLLPSVWALSAGNLSPSELDALDNARRFVPIAALGAAGDSLRIHSIVRDDDIPAQFGAWRADY